jgi:hypothetical protein
MVHCKVLTNDSIALNSFWKDFLFAIENKDTSEIRKLSLPQIDCDLCLTIDYKNYSPPDDYIISIDTFLLKNIYDLTKSQLWKAIKLNRCHQDLAVIYDFPRRNLPYDYGKDLILYEMWVQTYKPNEWVKGHEGQSHAFQFVKYKNEYKFYGMTSIP